MGFDSVNNCLLLLLLAATLTYACGDNPSTMVQGPFKDSAFNNGLICFQNSQDKRDVDFYQSYSKKNGEYNRKVDTFNYADAPAEVLSVFFTPIAGERYVVVLLRWSVNYSTNGILYPYHYEVKTYRHSEGSGYELYLDSDKDAALSGYQTMINGEISNYALDNAIKIKKYLYSKYGV